MSAAEALSDSDLLVRPSTAADAAFILDSWLKSYRTALDHVPGPIYWRFQRETVERLLSRSEVLVACNPESPEQVFGYAVAESRGPVRVIHYLYVKHPFRGMGIGRSLLGLIGGHGAHYTHHTHAGLKLARAFSARFNPYLAGVSP